MNDRVRTPMLSARSARVATPGPMPPGPPAQSKRDTWMPRFMPAVLPAGAMLCSVQIDLLFDPFGVRVDDVLRGATAAEQAGFAGVWLYDHLAGSVHRQDRVVECWTTLTAVAATVPRIMVGPLVLNVANRPAGTLAVMAATLQELSGGRLLLGIGAGGGIDTPYADEQEALGRAVPGDERRRAAVADCARILKEGWRGHTGGASGFLPPQPAPPINLGGVGPEI